MINLCWLLRNNYPKKHATSNLNITAYDRGLYLQVEIVFGKTLSIWEYLEINRQNQCVSCFNYSGFWLLRNNFLKKRATYGRNINANDRKINLHEKSFLVITKQLSEKTRNL